MYIEILTKSVASVFIFFLGPVAKVYIFIQKTYEVRVGKVGGG